MVRLKGELALSLEPSAFYHNMLQSLAKMIKGKTEQETVELTAFVLGVNQDQAREIIAIERGESDGDVIETAE